MSQDRLLGSGQKLKSAEPSGEATKKGNKIMHNTNAKTQTNKVNKKTNNKTIMTAQKSADNQKVKKITQFLSEHRNEKVLVTFVKNDNTERKIVFVPNNEYNKITGKANTRKGNAISKAKNGMITVVENIMVTDEHGIQHEGYKCRTVNLNTVLNYRVVNSMGKAA